MTDCNEYNESCKLQPFQKNNYFNGKLMTVSDFETEQAYMDAKRRLLSRLISGNGIVCGLQEVTVITKSDGNVQLKFEDGGAALDRCGNEIIVPPGTIKDVYVKDGEGKKNLDKNAAGTSPPYVYLEYEECLVEPVPAMAEISDCSHVCCDNRKNESFNVIASSQKPTPPTSPPASPPCPDYSHCFQEGSGDRFKQVMEVIRNTAGSEYCTDPCERTEPGVFIGQFPDPGASPETLIHAWEYDHDSYVFTNPFLAELFACHMADDNPHKTLQGLKVDETGDEETEPITVDNKDGYITIDKENAITLKATPAGDEEEPKITIGENHSGLEGNPHNTKHVDLINVKGVNGYVDKEEEKQLHVTKDDVNHWNAGVFNINDVHPDETGKIIIDKQNAITLEENEGEHKITIGENHSGSEGNPHNVKHEELSDVKGFDTGVPDADRNKHISNNDAIKWDSAVYSINGLNPDDDGNFGIEAGDNIDITPGTNSIKISSTGLYEAIDTGLLQGKDIWTYEHKFGRYPVVDVYEKVVKPESKKKFTFFLEDEAGEIAKKMNIPEQDLLKKENSLSLVRKRDDAIPVVENRTKTRFNEFLDKLKNNDDFKKRNFEFSATEKLLRKNPHYGIAEKTVYFVFEADYNGRKILGSNASPDVEVIVNEHSVSVKITSRNKYYFLKVILSA